MPYRIPKLLLLSTCFISLPVFAESRDSVVLDELNAWNKNISDEDRTSKYCKMATSPFIFYRGTNHLFWKDFANDSRLQSFGNAKTQTWLQGDLHAYNYGAYDNDKEEVVYGLNDFDESIIADYQYDIWRMATSLVLIAHEEASTLDKKQQAEMLDTFSAAYLEAMTSYRGNDKETQQSFNKDNTDGKLDDFLVQTADDNSRKKMLKKWTHTVDGVNQFNLSLDKLGTASDAEKQAILAAMPAYGETLSGGLKYHSEYFQVKDIAQRLLAGTGSLGTPRFYLLIEGKTDKRSDDRILDVKRQSKPTPYVYLGEAVQARYDANFSNDAQRHALAYLGLTKQTDDHLGWMQLNNIAEKAGDYSVRERSPYKESFDTTTLTSAKRFNKLAKQWGSILATAHARADKDYRSDLVATSVDKYIDEATQGKQPEFQALVRDIATAYATQVEADWQVFLKHLKPQHCPSH